ncbi:MAG TPA: hypothetical protein VEX35_01815 [Allosphingosinicella sp.]|nr:hypothetical protein [Allosphingosinicella sp.]
MGEDWRNILIQRDSEMAQLQQCWWRAKAGEPMVAAIVAESGFGKTRLCQEFFGWLSTHEDGAEPLGYWPDRLGADEDNLRVNPDSGGGSQSEEPMPFLWWGMRLTDPGQRNQQFGTALREAKNVLAEHLYRYAAREQRVALEGKRGSAQKKLALDLGVEAVGNLASFGLLGALKSIAEYRQDVETIDHQLGAIVQAMPEATETNLVDTIVLDLGRVCSNPPENLAPVPIVIMIDDAQWCDRDAMVGELLDRILVVSAAEQWPLLILLTCWEREWRGEGHFGLGGHLRALGAEPVPIEIKPLELKPVIQSALPGLTNEQYDAITAKTDGNPSYLAILINTLLARPRLFAGRDTGAHLSEEGETFLLEQGLDDIVLTRFLDSPAEVQLVLGAASLQGMTFSPSLALRTCAHFGRNTHFAHFVRAEDPYAFVKLSSRRAGEFRQRNLWKVARSRLTDLVDQEEADRAYQSALIEGGAEDDEQSDEILAQEIDSPDIARRAAALNALARIASRAAADQEHANALKAASIWLDRALADRGEALYVSDLEYLDRILSLSHRQGDFKQLIQVYFDALMADVFPNGVADATSAGIDALDLLTSVCAVMASGIAGHDTTVRRRAAEAYVGAAKIALSRIDETSAGRLWPRTLRVALQRQSDLTDDPAESLPLVLHQLELAREIALGQPATESTPDLFNTLVRLATARKKLGEFDLAEQAMKEGVALWERLAETNPSHQAFFRSALAIKTFITLLRQPPYDEATRSIARLGLGYAIKAFNLGRDNHELPACIFTLLYIAGKNSRKDSELKAFARAAEAHLQRWLVEIEGRDVLQVERSLIVSLAELLGLVWSVLSDYPKEVQSRIQLVKLIERLDSPTENSRSAWSINFQYALLTKSSFRRLRIYSAFKYWRLTQKWAKVIFEILQQHGYSIMDILRCIRANTVPSLSRMADAGHEET